MIKIFRVDPMGKPRMTKSDKWKKRDRVEKYWAFKYAIQLQKGDFVMPASGYHVIFHIPMPQSWKIKIKASMDGAPHMHKPDLDNLLKALWDSLCIQDNYIWSVHASKRWAREGSIEIITE